MARPNLKNEYEIKQVAEWICYAQLTKAKSDIKKLVDCNFFQVAPVTEKQNQLRRGVPHAYGYDADFQTRSKQPDVEGQYHILHGVKGLWEKLKLSGLVDETFTHENLINNLQKPTDPQGNVHFDKLRRLLGDGISTNQLMWNSERAVGLFSQVRHNLFPVLRKYDILDDEVFANVNMIPTVTEKYPQCPPSQLAFLHYQNHEWSEKFAREQKLEVARCENILSFLTARWLNKAYPVWHEAKCVEWEKEVLAFAVKVSDLRDRVKALGDFKSNLRVSLYKWLFTYESKDYEENVDPESLKRMEADVVEAEKQVGVKQATDIMKKLTPEQQLKALYDAGDYDKPQMQGLCMLLKVDNFEQLWAKWTESSSSSSNSNRMMPTTTTTTTTTAVKNKNDRKKKDDEVEKKDGAKKDDEVNDGTSKKNAIGVGLDDDGNDDDDNEEDTGAITGGSRTMSKEQSDKIWNWWHGDTGSFRDILHKEPSLKNNPNSKPADYREAVLTLNKKDYKVAYKAIRFLLSPLTFDNKWIFDSLEKLSASLRQAVEAFTDDKDDISDGEWKQLDAEIERENERENEDEKKRNENGASAMMMMKTKEAVKAYSITTLIKEAKGITEDQRTLLFTPTGRNTLIFQYRRFVDEKCDFLNPHKKQRHSIVGKRITWNELNRIQFVEPYGTMMRMVVKPALTYLNEGGRVNTLVSLTSKALEELKKSEGDDFKLHGKLRITAVNDEDFEAVDNLNTLYECFIKESEIVKAPDSSGGKQAAKDRVPSSSDDDDSSDEEENDTVTTRPLSTRKRKKVQQVNVSEMGNDNVPIVGKKTPNKKQKRRRGGKKTKTPTKN